MREEHVLATARRIGVTFDHPKQKTERRTELFACSLFVDCPELARLLERAEHMEPFAGRRAWRDDPQLGPGAKRAHVGLTEPPFGEPRFPFLGERFGHVGNALPFAA